MEIKQFEWDDKNINKNWIKPRVHFSECEEIFLNEQLLIAEIEQSRILYQEKRHFAYGVTNSARLLFVVLTIRNEKIRIISARDMSKKERRFYYEETKKLD